VAVADTWLSTENHLVALARRAGRLPSLWLTLVVGTAIVILGELLFGLPVFLATSAVTGQAPRSWSAAVADSAVLSGLYQTVALVVSFLGVYVLVWLWLRWYERRPFWTVGFERAGAVRKALRGAVAGLLMLGGAVALMAVAGFAAPEDGPPQLQGPAAASGVLVALLGWAVQGPAEELVCRGWMLPVLAARYRLWLGVLVSSLFFAVLHGVNPGLTPIAGLNLALYGLFAALYALREGGLWGIGAQHAAWNWAQGNLFGFQVSGIEPAGGMLVNLMETGPDEVTGGAFGPEGGLAITLVLLAGIVVLLAVGRPSIPPSRDESVRA
jgi:membrane protease YdiL (CAAX protease family)